MTAVRTAGRASAAALAAALVLAGCGGPGPSGTTPRPTTAAPAADWPQVAAPVAATGLVVADGGSVLLGDGTEVRTGPVEEFVVAGEGVWFVPEGSDELTRTSPDGPVATGVEPLPGTLTSSADGRYLAFLHRPDDLAVTVVVDLVEGREVVSTSRGMGEEGTDLDDLYEDADPGVLGIDATTAYVDALGDLLLLDLSDGSVRDEGSTDFWSTPWADALYPDAATSPDGRWTLRGGRVQSEEGTVTPRLGRYEQALGEWRIELRGWVDGSTAAGIAYLTEPATGLRAVVTCRVPSGRCRTVGPPLADLVLPNGPDWPRREPTAP